MTSLANLPTTNRKIGSGKVGPSGAARAVGPVQPIGAAMLSARPVELRDESFRLRDLRRRHAGARGCYRAGRPGLVAWR